MNLAAVDLLQAGDGVQQRRLSAAGGAEQHDELSVGDGEFEVLQNRQFAVGDAKVADVDFCHPGLSLH